MSDLTKKICDILLVEDFDSEKARQKIKKTICSFFEIDEKKFSEKDFIQILHDCLKEAIGEIDDKNVFCEYVDACSDAECVWDLYNSIFDDKDGERVVNKLNISLYILQLAAYYLDDDTPFNFDDEDDIYDPCDGCCCCYERDFCRECAAFDDDDDDDEYEVEKINIYVVGYNEKESGKGAFCTIVSSDIYGDDMIFGDDRYTTENRINLLGILNGLNCIDENEVNEDSTVIVHVSDKNLWTYFESGIVSAWKKNEWRTLDGFYDLPNADLWRRIDKLATKYQAKFNYLEIPKEKPLDKLVVCADIAKKILTEDNED